MLFIGPAATCTPVGFFLSGSFGWVYCWSLIWEATWQSLRLAIGRNCYLLPRRQSPRHSVAKPALEPTSRGPTPGFESNGRLRFWGFSLERAIRRSLTCRLLVASRPRRDAREDFCCPYRSFQFASVFVERNMIMLSTI